MSKGNRYESTFIFVVYGFYNQLLKKNQSLVFTLVFAYFMSQFGLMRFKDIVYNNIFTCIHCDWCLVLKNFALRTHRRMSLSLDLKSGGNDYLLQVQAYKQVNP